MGSLFLKTPQSYILSELKSKKSAFNSTRLKPWIQATSNLGSGRTISTLGYKNVFGADQSVYNSGTTPRFLPNPIITEFSVDFSAKGSLRKATLKIQCFNIEQFTEMQKYFMEPGASVFVQWGWNHTSDGKSVTTVSTDAATQAAYYRNFDQLNDIRNSNNGCYDNMLGIINKGESEIAGQEFNITCKIVSLGEMLAGRIPSDPDDNFSGEKEPDVLPAIYTSTELTNLKQSTGLHWARFFNAMPEQFRNDLFLPGRSYPTTNPGINPEVDFIDYDEVWVEEAKGDTGEDDWDFNFLGKTFDPQDDESPISSKKYIKFSALISLFNAFIQKGYTDSSSNISYMIDIGTRNNPRCIAGAFKEIFSCNENIFIPNNQAYNWYNENPYFVNSSKPGKGPAIIDNSVKNYAEVSAVSFPYTFVVKFDGAKFPAYSVGWIGDVYVEHDLAMEFLTNTSTSIKDNLDNLLKEMAVGVDGMWDFQAVETTVEGVTKLRIIDANLTNKTNEITPIEFTLFGTDSVFLEGTFNFDIPKEMANQIALTRTSGGGAASTTTGLKGLFTAEQDSVLSILMPKPSAAAVAQNQQATPPENEQDEDAIWAGFRKPARILLQPKCSTLGTMQFGDKYFIPGVSINKEAFNKFWKKNVAGGNGSTSPLLPLKINFTIFGMSAFKFGDTVIIKGLPTQYTDTTKGVFMVTEVTHKVDNTLWTTNIECMYRANPIL